MKVEVSNKLGEIARIDDPIDGKRVRRAAPAPVFGTLEGIVCEIKSYSASANS